MAQVQRVVRTPTILIKVDGSDLPVSYMDDLLDLDVESSLFLPSMARLTFYDDSIEITDSETFAPGKKLELLASEVDFTANTPTPVSVFKGEIVAVEPFFSLDGRMELTIRAYDKRHRLNSQRKTKTFLNQKDSDIISELCGQAGLSCQVAATSSVHPYVLQHNLSDLEFIYQLAYRNSLELAMEDEKLLVRKRNTAATVNLEWGTSLASFRPNLSLGRQVSEVSVRGWDMMKKEPIIGSASSSQHQPKVGYGVATQKVTSAFSAMKYTEVEYPIYTQSDADKLAQAILDEISSKFIQAEGTVYGTPKLIAGSVVKIEKVGTKFSGEYHVTSALHRYSKDGYEVDFRVEGAYPLPLTGGGGPSFFGDGFSGQARYHGVYIGIVTNNNDPDKLSRVKVKFPWLSMQEESHWARLSMPGAGSARGFYVMPELNDEVLIAFEHGDPNRPVVLGNMWNGKDKSPIPQSEAVTGGKVKTRIFQTRDGHYLKFVDDPNGYIELQDKSGNTQIKLDYTNKEIDVKSNGKVNIEGKSDLLVKTATKITIDASTSIEIKSNGSIKVNATGSLDLSATGNVTIKGAMVNIN